MKNNHFRLEFCRSVAVIGGTFDPIHNGHLVVAETVSAILKPQKILFVPSGCPPHKMDKPVSDFEHRYNMTMLATADNPSFDVSRMEAERPGPSFTVDTIHELKSECLPDADIYFVTGADAVFEILSWHDAGELFKACKFVAVTRPGFVRGKLKKHIEMLRKKFSAKIQLLEVPGMEISGSDLRARFASGESVRYLTPRLVEDYARANNLYGAGGFDFDECKKTVAKILSAKRFNHTMGVVESAEELARLYGADVTKARIAALLHDCTKEYSDDKKRALCALWGIPLDEVLDKQISITHSLLSAESARRDFGINDEEILQAIRFHTTGCRGMTLLDKVVMLADFIEPNRDPYDGLEEIRALAYKNIDEALIYGISETIRLNEEKERPVHPWSREALEELRLNKRENINGQ